MKDKIVRKGLVLGIIVLFVGAGVIPSMGGTVVERHVPQDNKTSFTGFTPRGNIFYVGGSGPNNYTKIQDAINDSSSGDTVFVYDYSSPYVENVIVDKSINLIGENRDTTIIDGDGSGDVVRIETDWVTIKELTITKGEIGIQVNNFSNTTMTNCDVHNNSIDGICLHWYSNNNQIINCDVYNIPETAIELHGSSNNLIENCTVNNSTDSIFLGFSSNNNTVTNCNVYNNNYGLWHSGNDNTITNCNAYNNEYGIFLQDSKNNNITSNNISSNNRCGIIFDVSSNNNITGNNISNNEEGMELDSSSSNTITGNTISNNEDGIELWYSSSNNITGNTISYNRFGISLDYSSSNNITGNTISYNRFGIELDYSSSNNITGNSFLNDGLVVYDSYHNNVENNTVNGKPLVYLEDESYKVIDDAGQVILIKCDNITIQNQELSNTTVSILLYDTNNSLIHGNTISSNNKEGIYLYYSSSNNITSNNISSNNKTGICFDDSIINIITGNNISNNHYGIGLWDSSSNTITGNNISNNYNGIFLWDSSGNTITGNTISSNDNAGIIHSGSSSNTITGNNISNNHYGIGLWDSSSNTITGNNISNNHYSISLYRSSGNNITGNTISYNRFGIELEYSSSNTITNNNIILNNDSGIYLRFSSDSNIIANNICNSNNVSGIYLDSSDNNIISSNNCSSNAGYGISLKSTKGCVIDGNTVNDNKAIYKPNNTGLVGYWKMDEASWNGTLGEVIDSSGNGNNGTAKNGANTTSFGISGRAGEFDGEDDYISISSLSPIQNTSINTFTFEVWIKSVQNTGDIQQVFEAHTSTGEIFLEGVLPGELRFLIADESGYNREVSTETLSLNQWYHIVCTYDGSIQKIYVNGILQDSYSWSNTFTINTGITLGKDFEKNIQYFKGTIDEVRIYHRALSSEEINQFIAFNGINLEQSDNNIITNNACRGNRNGINLDSSSDSNMVDNNTCMNNHRGINLNSSSNSNIVENNFCLNNYHGISLNSSSSNTIADNTCAYNDDGIILEESWNSIISGNAISSNNDDGLAIDNYCSMNTIIDNTIFSNNDDGIYLHISYSNTITGNTISNNDDGVWLMSRSSSNIIQGNNISNSNCGIRLNSFSSYNIIYYNNFINNGESAYDECSNTWDDDEYGNYWDDYKERYPNAKKKLLKGIWDTPYEIPGGGNKDMCPLINQWPKPYVFIVDEEQNSQANPVISMNPKTTTKDNSIAQINVRSLKSI